MDDDAAPGGDGLSWGTAYRFLQDAIANEDAAKIRVAQGIYRPDRDEANPLGTGDRDATFHLQSVALTIGGYAGIGAGNPDDRDVEAYETVLSGDLLGNDGPDFENNEENSTTVVVADFWSSGVIDGFTISAGNRDPGSLPLYAGGMFLGESATVRDCTFTRNVGPAGGAALVQAGINATEDWELFARYEWSDFDLPDFEYPGPFTAYSFQNLSLVTFGFSRFFSGHDLKWTTDFGYAINRVEFFAADPGAGYRSNTGGSNGQWVVRSQFQLAF